MESGYRLAILRCTDESQRVGAARAAPTRDGVIWLSGRCRARAWRGYQLALEDLLRSRVTCDLHQVGMADEDPHADGPLHVIGLTCFRLDGDGCLRFRLGGKLVFAWLRVVDEVTSRGQGGCVNPIYRDRVADRSATHRGRPVDVYGGLILGCVAIGRV